MEFYSILILSGQNNLKINNYITNFLLRNQNTNIFYYISYVAAIEKAVSIPPRYTGESCASVIMCLCVIMSC